MARGRWRARALAGLPEKMAFWIFEVRVAAMVRVMTHVDRMRVYESNLKLPPGE